jgi:hypothetical protein
MSSWPSGAASSTRSVTTRQPGRAGRRRRRRWREWPPSSARRCCAPKPVDCATQTTRVNYPSSHQVPGRRHGKEGQSFFVAQRAGQLTHGCVLSDYLFDGVSAGSRGERQRCRLLLISHRSLGGGKGNDLRAINPTVVLIFVNLTAIAVISHRQFPEATISTDRVTRTSTVAGSAQALTFQPGYSWP